MMLPSRLGCPLSLKTPNMGNTGSLIPGIGTAKRQDLVVAGFPTVSTLDSTDEHTLSKIRGIGPTTARKFITSAKAIRQSRPIQREQKPQIPHAKTQVFLDLEGTDSRIGADGLEVANYLIGALVRRHQQPATYLPFFASSFEEEEGNLRGFFEWAGSLEDALFFHWHHYERTHLQRMTGHYKPEQSQVLPVIDTLVDLSPITTKSFAFPTYGEGLKEVAKSLGFSWRQEDVNALASIALYFQYIDSGGTDIEAQQKILDYNEDDCRATMHVYDWLMSQTASA